MVLSIGGNKMHVYRTCFWAVPAILLWLTSSCCPDEAKGQNLGAAGQQTKPDSIVVVDIRAVGDLMCHSTQFEYAKVGPDTFDFRRCYAEVKSYLSGADFTIGNIETVFAGANRKYTGYPMFNTPEDYLDAVKEAGFDFLVSANNHSLDRGESGALRTLEVLDNYGFGHTGTYANLKDRDSIRIVNINGLRMAILNYTYGTNGIPIPAGKPWIINIIDSTLIADDVIKARKLKPDLVTVFFHWGLEYQHEPCDSQRYALRAAISGGADIVLGSHPHVIQPVEYFKTQGDATLDSGFVIWSMGNFISNQYQRYCDAGMILDLKIAKNFKNDSVWIDQVNYLPTWVFRGQSPKQKIHTILPAERFAQDSAYSYMTADWRKKMKEAFEDTDKYLNLYRPISRASLQDTIPK
jgi:poly-gamma-glutamate capsule biosynthesis protein CapA/YwtB (metallophosphatase superfamily)